MNSSRTRRSLPRGKSPRNNTCSICNDKEKSHQRWILCDSCCLWYHIECLNEDPDYIESLGERDYLCYNCRPSPGGSRRSSLAGSSSRALRSSQQSNLAGVNSDIPEVGQQSPQEVDCHATMEDPPESAPIDQVAEDPADDIPIAVSLMSRQSTSRLSTRQRQPSVREPQPSTSRQSSRQQSVDQAGQRPSAPSRHALSKSTTATDGEYDTDDEGYAEVDEILDWRSVRGDRRQFLVRFKKNNEEAWLPEENLNGCVSRLNLFCRMSKIPPTKLKYKSGCGSTSAYKNENNWATIDRILELIDIYGRQDSITPSKFDGLKDRDALTLMQVGEHCLVLLYLAATKTCYIADGTNAFRSDRTTRQLVIGQLGKVRYISGLHFDGQLEEDQCASSAAGIAIEFQRLYKAGETPKNELKVPRSIMDRLRARVHKEAGPKIRDWKPISNVFWQVECPKCGKTFKTSNRSVLNLHRCE